LAEYPFSATGLADVDRLGIVEFCNEVVQGLRQAMGFNVGQSLFPSKNSGSGRHQGTTSITTLDTLIIRVTRNYYLTNL
jgi:hypothetical protein